MIFKCQNCGGNVLYNPEKGSMHCPHCDSVESQQKMESSSQMSCDNCGAPLETEQFTSASKCAHCGNYIIFDEKVQGMYRPNLILPFKVGKQQAKDILKKEFKKKAFTPSGFLKDAALEKMEGSYVPFWLYDYQANYVYNGEGIRVRSWTTGNTEYTETSHYHVYRDMDIEFNKIPVDASDAMDDKVMDLMEPYNYNILEDFDEKYMSGFLSEVFNQPADTLEPRAREKAARDAEGLMRESLNGYDTLKPYQKNLTMNRNGLYYALFPVWVYTYNYQNKRFPFYINGQTGKVVGKTPLSIKKMVGYAATVFGLAYAMIYIVANGFII